MHDRLLEKKIKKIWTFQKNQNIFSFSEKGKKKSQKRPKIRKRALKLNFLDFLTPILYTSACSHSLSVLLAVHNRKKKIIEKKLPKNMPKRPQMSQNYEKSIQILRFAFFYPHNVPKRQFCLEISLLGGLVTEVC